MENIQLNNVNISLAEYNKMQSDLTEQRDLLKRATAELNLLIDKQDKNKILVIERQRMDGQYGTLKTVENLHLNIEDSEVSKKVLDIISKVETNELSNTVKTKEEEIKQLKSKIDTLDETLLSTKRNTLFELKKEKDQQKEAIYDIRKEYDDKLLDLEIENEELSKTLKNLKLNKTEEQLEIVRQQEIADLKDKINTLESFTNMVTDNASNPFKLRTYLKNFALARRFREGRSWINNVYTNTITALENVQAFSKVMNSIGVKKDSDTKANKAYAQPSPTYVTNNYYNEEY